jgi:O-antigen/teichoic acid export membrane protein
MGISDYLRNELIISSVILLILSNIANILNFVFQFGMARFLDAPDFGVLCFLGNLFFLFAIPGLAIQTAISKRTTYLASKGEYGRIKGLFNSSTQKIFKISLFLIALFLATSLIFHQKVGISMGVLALSSLLIFISLAYPIMTGIIQGLKKFQFLGWNNLLNFSVKLIIGFALVIAGLKIYGAIIGIILGMFVGWVVSMWVINSFKGEKEDIKFYSREELVPFVSLLIITLMYSVDILIAKFVFPAEIMGNYSKISLLGKMILFACMTIAMVMFPISLERHISKRNNSGIIRKSLALIITLIIAGVGLFYFFPEFIVRILFGNSYIGFSSVLFPIGVAFSFISLLNLFVLYKISINKLHVNDAIGMIILFIIQFAVMIYFSGSIYSFSWAFAGISGFILVFAILINYMGFKNE